MKSRIHNLLSLLILGAVVVAPAGGAIAADTNGHGPEYGLTTVDVGAAIWTIIIFALLLLLLGRFAWRPIQNVLIEREKFITDSLAQAKADRAAAEARLQEYEAKLTKAQEEASGIVEEGRRDGTALKHKIEEEAREEAKRLVERAKREIEVATDTAIKEIYDLTGKLATDVASKIIRREVDQKEHDRLIAESIDEISRAVGKRSA